MCEANAFMAALEGDAEDDLILEAVDRIEPDGRDQWKLISIFGEQKRVSGRIKYMNLVEHRIVFEPCRRAD